MSGAPYLADTSVMIGIEQGRLARLPDDRPIALSVITLAELHLGVINAADQGARRQRLRTLLQAQAYECLGIDVEVAERWAGLVAYARTHGKRLPVNDAWIA